MGPVELDVHARQVIAEGRNAYQPSELACARVRRAVDRKLAAGAAVPEPMSLRATPAWVKYWVGAAVASVVSLSFAYAVLGPKRMDSPLPALTLSPNAGLVSKSAAVASHAAPQVPSALPAEPSVAADSPSSPPRALPSTSNKSEDLAEEVRLLASVNSAIQGHDGALALRLLHTYDQQFKKPVLREERAAAGVLAFCAAGQVDAARVAARRFRSSWPRSPLMARVVDSCAAAK
jgi:hypothetical protein